MKAIVTSIGETTEDLCIWSLERLGFKVELIKSNSSLFDKLVQIFSKEDDDFVRVDADVIVNRNILELIKQDEAWWYQAMTFDWFKQDITHGGVQFIKKECLSAIREHIHEAADKDRPESYLCRLQEFHNPRRFQTFEKICGLTGYKQDDIKRVKETKLRRGHYDEYDWELAEMIEQL